MSIEVRKLRKIYFTLDKDNFLTGWGSTRSSEDEIELDLPINHELFNSDFQCWRYEDNELVFDEERQQQLIKEYEHEQDKLNESDMLSLAILELAVEIEKLKGDQ